MFFIIDNFYIFLLPFFLIGFVFLNSSYIDVMTMITSNRPTGQKIMLWTVHRPYSMVLPLEFCFLWTDGFNSCSFPFSFVWSWLFGRSSLNLPLFSNGQNVCFLFDFQTLLCQNALSKFDHFFWIWDFNVHIL